LCAAAPGGGTVGDLAHRVLDIAAQGLAARDEVNSMGDNEVGFLEPLRQIAKSGKSPAHDLLDRYEGAWGRDLSRIYDELSF
ncbi:MAG: glutamate--cysteine ligase, partial [Sphingopyxis granuli]